MKYLFLCLFLVGCSKYSGPYKVCLESHNQTVTQMVPIGKTLIPQVRIVNICDKYSVQQYIKVDKTVYEVQKVYETGE